MGRFAVSEPRRAPKSLNLTLIGYLAVSEPRRAILPVREVRQKAREGQEGRRSPLVHLVRGVRGSGSSIGRRVQRVRVRVRFRLGLAPRAGQPGPIPHPNLALILTLILTSCARRCSCTTAARCLSTACSTHRSWRSRLLSRCLPSSRRRCPSLSRQTGSWCAS